MSRTLLIHSFHAANDVNFFDDGVYFITSFLFELPPPLNIAIKQLR